MNNHRFLYVIFVNFCFLTTIQITLGDGNEVKSLDNNNDDTQRNNNNPLSDFYSKSVTIGFKIDNYDERIQKVLNEQINSRRSAIDAALRREELDSGEKKNFYRRKNNSPLDNSKVEGADEAINQDQLAATEPRGGIDPKELQSGEKQRITNEKPWISWNPFSTHKRPKRPRRPTSRPPPPPPKPKPKPKPKPPPPPPKTEPPPLETEPPPPPPETEPPPPPPETEPPPPSETEPPPPPETEPPPPPETEPPPPPETEPPPPPETEPPPPPPPPETEPPLPPTQKTTLRRTRRPRPTRNRWDNKKKMLDPNGKYLKRTTPYLGHHSNKRNKVIKPDKSFFTVFAKYMTGNPFSITNSHEKRHVATEKPYIKGHSVIWDRDEEDFVNTRKPHKTEYSIDKNSTKTEYMITRNPHKRGYSVIKNPHKFRHSTTQKSHYGEYVVTRKSYTQGHSFTKKSHKDDYLVSNKSHGKEYSFSREPFDYENLITKKSNGKGYSFTKEPYGYKNLVTQKSHGKRHSSTIESFDDSHLVTKKSYEKEHSFANESPKDKKLVTEKSLTDKKLVTEKSHKNNYSSTNELYENGPLVTKKSQGKEYSSTKKIYIIENLVTGKSREKTHLFTKESYKTRHSSTKKSYNKGHSFTNEVYTNKPLVSQNLHNKGHSSTKALYANGLLVTKGPTKINNLVTKIFNNTEYMITEKITKSKEEYAVTHKPRITTHMLTNNSHSKPQIGRSSTESQRKVTKLSNSSSSRIKFDKVNRKTTNSHRISKHTSNVPKSSQPKILKNITQSHVGYDNTTKHSTSIGKKTQSNKQSHTIRHNKTKNVNGLSKSTKSIILEKLTTSLGSHKTHKSSTSYTRKPYTDPKLVMNKLKVSKPPKVKFTTSKLITHGQIELKHTTKPKNNLELIKNHTKFSKTSTVSPKTTKINNTLQKVGHKSTTKFLRHTDLTKSTTKILKTTVGVERTKKSSTPYKIPKKFGNRKKKKQTKMTMKPKKTTVKSKKTTIKSKKTKKPPKKLRLTTKKRLTTTKRTTVLPKWRPREPRISGGIPRNVPHIAAGIRPKHAYNGTLIPHDKSREKLTELKHPRTQISLVNLIDYFKPKNDPSLPIILTIKHKYTPCKCCNNNCPTTCDKSCCKTTNSNCKKSHSKCCNRPCYKNFHRQLEKIEEVGTSKFQLQTQQGDSDDVGVRLLDTEEDQSDVVGRIDLEPEVEMTEETIALRHGMHRGKKAKKSSRDKFLIECLTQKKNCDKFQAGDESAQTESNNDDHIKKRQNRFGAHGDAPAEDKNMTKLAYVISKHIVNSLPKDMQNSDWAADLAFKIVHEKLKMYNSGNFGLPPFGLPFQRNYVYGNSGNNGSNNCCCCCDEKDETSDASYRSHLDSQIDVKVGNENTYKCLPTIDKPPSEGYVLLENVGWFKFYDEHKPWNEARKQCFSEGAHLAFMESPQETQWCIDHILSESREEPFLGIHNYFRGDWVSVRDTDVEKMEHLKWSKEELDEYRSYNCAIINPQDKLVSRESCTADHPFICKVPL